MKYTQESEHQGSIRIDPNTVLEIELTGEFTVELRPGNMGELFFVVKPAAGTRPFLSLTEVAS